MTSLQAIAAVRAASKDSRVLGLVAHIAYGGGVGELARVQELLNAILQFRQAHVSCCLQHVCKSKLASTRHCQDSCC